MACKITCVAYHTFDGMDVKCCGYFGNYCKAVALASCFVGAGYLTKTWCAEKSKNPMPKVYVNYTCIPGIFVLKGGMLILLAAHNYQYLYTACFIACTARIGVVISCSEDRDRDLRACTARCWRFYHIRHPMSGIAVPALMPDQHSVYYIVPNETVPYRTQKYLFLSPLWTTIGACRGLNPMFRRFINVFRRPIATVFDCICAANPVCAHGVIYV